MAKISKKDIEKAVEEARTITGLPFIFHDVRGGYGLSFLLDSPGPGLINTEPLSPKFETRDEFLLWLQGFVTGWSIQT